MSKQLTIIHIQLKYPNKNQQTNYYFGSKAAVFQYFTKEQLGIGYQYLLNLTAYIDKDNIIYNGKLCTIRKDTLRTAFRRSSQQDE